MFATAQIANRLWEVTARQWTVTLEYEPAPDRWKVQAFEPSTTRADGTVMAYRIYVDAEHTYVHPDDEASTVSSIVEQMRHGEEYYDPRKRYGTRARITSLAGAASNATNAMQNFVNTAQGGFQPPADAAVGETYLDPDSNTTWVKTRTGWLVAMDPEFSELEEGRREEERRRNEAHEAEAREIFEATRRRLAESPPRDARSPEPC